MILRTLLIIFTIELLICGQQLCYPQTPNKRTGKFIPLNFKNPKYSDFAFTHDTITLSGWKISYFVKDDSTKYEDVYIKWSKGTLTRIKKMEGVLLMRGYFIPDYIGENARYLFMTHGCATECSALLALPKDSINEAQDFGYVIDYNIPNGQLVYVPEKSYSHQKLEVSVVDLMRKKEEAVIFKNVCNVLPESGCIDSISFEKNRIKLFATLIEKNDAKHEKEIQETHIVNLDR